MLHKIMPTVWGILFVLLTYWLVYSVRLSPIYILFGLAFIVGQLCYEVSFITYKKEKENDS